MYDAKTVMSCVKAMKLGLIMHCLAGVFFYSNDDTFHYNRLDKTSIFSAEINYWVNLLLQIFTGTKVKESLESYEKDDISQYVDLAADHTTFYILGIVIFLIIVVLEEVFGTLTSIGRFIAYMMNIDNTEQLARDLMLNRMEN